MPALAPAVKGREFSVAGFATYAKYTKENPDALKKLGLTPQQASTIGNYIDGKRSVRKIRDLVVGETGRDLPIESVAGYIDMLKTVGWVVYAPARTN